jgi:hypothetical protein
MTALTAVYTDIVGFEGTPITYTGDGLVELDQNLQPVWTWSAFDHLDVNYSPVDPVTPARAVDWTHGNAVTYSPADGNLLVSLRNVHMVVKIDYRDGRGSGNVLWKLGPAGDIQLTGGTLADFQYAQHYPFVIEDRNGIMKLGIYDNGNDRPDSQGNLCNTGGTACFSRAVIYEIDQANKTGKILWEHRPGLFAPFIGSIQVFPSGNVVYCNGTISGLPTPRILEVSQGQTPQVLWEMRLQGQFAYRSLRLPSLYPGVQW